MNTIIYDFFLYKNDNTISTKGSPRTNPTIIPWIEVSMVHIIGKRNKSAAKPAALLNGSST